jgi:ABC-2 type transport system permease protein
VASQPAAIQPGVIAVRVPEGGLRHDLRAVKVVWQRELIRFWRDRRRIVTSLLQPVLFLFVLGTGLSTIASTGSVNLRTFIFPGALGLAVLFTAVFSAASIVWDREFGFLREMLVAPVRRSAIVFGKCMGGATVATFQGLVMLSLAGVVDVPYAPLMLLTLFGELLLLAFTLTAFGVMAAARIQQIQSFMGLVQMFVMPLFFLSGALFPLTNLPSWLAVLNRLDPLTYAIDPMRRAVFHQLSVSSAVRHRLIPGVTWWGWHVPTPVELAIVALMGLAMLGIGIAQFSRPE